MDRATDAFAAAVRAAAQTAGANLSAAATDALVKALDADESNWFLSRYIETPPAALVETAVAKYLKASPPKAEDKAGAHPDTFGVDPETWAKLSPLNRLTIAREAQTKAKPAPKSFQTKRVEAELHAARLRVNSLTGEDRTKAVQRVASLEAQLKEARAAQ